MARKIRIVEESDIDAAPKVFVSVVVLMCRDRMLAVYNPTWGAFTLPMTKLRKNETWLPAAIRAASECTGRRFHSVSLPKNTGVVSVADAVWAPPRGLIRTGEYRQSGRDQVEKMYLFHVFGLTVDKKPPLDPEIAGIWLTPSEFLGKNVCTISGTADFLTRKLIGIAKRQQKVFPNRTIQWPY